MRAIFARTFFISSTYARLALHACALLREGSVKVDGGSKVEGQWRQLSFPDTFGMPMYRRFARCPWKVEASFSNTDFRYSGIGCSFFFVSIIYYTNPKS